jgi:hypothetical protein
VRRIQECDQGSAYTEDGHRLCADCEAERELDAYVRAEPDYDAIDDPWPYADGSDRNDWQ